LAQIIFIDPNADNRDALERALKSAGHDLISAVDGQHGMELCRANPEAVVVTSLFLPHQSGMKVIMELRAAFPKVVIIAFCQGQGLTNLTSFVRWLGATRTLCRPCPPQELLAAVDEAGAASDQHPRPAPDEVPP
jgi:two-component system chemotaxis response regulator CheY